MVPATLHDFFVASTGASAALIGLLFVAVSIAPERVFGPAASVERFSSAGSTVIVLGNGFFISLGSLLPDLNAGYIVLLAGAIGLANSISLVVEIWRRRSPLVVRGLLVILASLVIYTLEIWWGSILLAHPGDAPTLNNITYVVLAGYALGLRRAWELVGGHDYSILLGGLARARRPQEGTSRVADPTQQSPDGR